MIDFFFAMIAAGMNSGSDGAPSADVALAEPRPAPAEAPATPQAGQAAITDPTVSTGGGVVIGQNVTIGGSTLLDGTSEDSRQAALPQIEQAPDATTGTSQSGVSTPVVPTPQIDTPVIATPVVPTPVVPTPDVVSDSFNMAVVPAGLVAEPQTPSGKFTTAAEVRPILEATKGNWVAVREYDGKDLLYVTHLWGWRCGLAAMAISVNDEPMQNWPLPACHTEFSTPNAILEDDGLPFLSLRLKAVQKIDIQIVYDDLSMDRASFARGDVLIP